MWGQRWTRGTGAGVVKGMGRALGFRGCAAEVIRGRTVCCGAQRRSKGCGFGRARLGKEVASMELLGKPSIHLTCCLCAICRVQPVHCFMASLFWRDEKGGSHTCPSPLPLASYTGSSRFTHCPALPFPQLLAKVEAHPRLKLMLAARGGALDCVARHPNPFAGEGEGGRRWAAVARGRGRMDLWGRRGRLGCIWQYIHYLRVHPHGHDPVAGGFRWARKVIGRDPLACA